MCVCECQKLQYRDCLFRCHLLVTNPLVQEGCLGHSFCHLSNLVRKHVLSSVGHCLDSNTGSAGRQPRITCYLEFRNMGIHKLSLLCFVCCLLWKCPQHLLTTPKGMASALERAHALRREKRAFSLEGLQILSSSID